MKKWYVILGVFLLVLAFGFIIKKCSDITENEKIQQKTINEDPCVKEKARADSLQAELDKCPGRVRPKTDKERIAELEKQLKNLSGRGGSRSKTVKVKAPTRDLTEKNFSGGGFAPINSSKSTEIIPGGNATLSTTLYEGGLEGDYCTTIDATGHIVYAMKNSVFLAGKPSIPAPRLNGENGQEMQLDKESGWWFYADGRLISVQEINNYQYAVEWNVYIGQTNYGTGSYPTYLPHQMLKPLINKTRGKEWGEISDEDLIKMRAENPNIWTPSSEGGLRPFRLDSENGRALGKEDRNLYQGWNFRTRIYAQKKTTIN